MKSVSAMLVGLSLLAGVAMAATAEHGGPPPNKKWKLVFSDEFEGTTLDATKWVKSHSSKALHWQGTPSQEDDANGGLDGHGNLVLKMTKDEKGVYRYHNGFDTGGKYVQTYGYFETRVQFTREPGWWGAVWLYGNPVGANPFLCGQEIDIFEDFVKPKTKNDLQHCLHIDGMLDPLPKPAKIVEGLPTDSLYRVSKPVTLLLDRWDGYHTVACEWTPLEYVFYVDGKETGRLDYKQAPVTTQPMRILISGCYRDGRKSTFCGDYLKARLPDQLVVDYVRAYQEDIGAKKRPTVRVAARDGVRLLKQLQPATFDVSAGDADGTVTQIYLFTNGRLLGERPAPPDSHAFSVSRLFYGENVIIAMAKDNDGLIGISEPITINVVGANDGKGAPYQGQAQAIPGRIIPGHYDEGGNRVAYFSYLKSNTYGKEPWRLTFRTKEGVNSPGADGIAASHRGMWVTYTVDIQKAGPYVVEPSLLRHDSQAAATESTDTIQLELDDRPLVDFQFSSKLTTGAAYWGRMKPLASKSVALPAGRHVLKVRFMATPFNFGGLKFDLAETK